MEFLLESIMEDKATKILYQNFYEAICEMNREAERIYCNLQEEDEWKKTNYNCMRWKYEEKL